jgi:uncharacterized protein (TIGR00369 family)
MKKINPAYVEAIKSGANGSPYFSLLEMKIIGFEIGTSHLEIEIEPSKHLQPFGAVHGGVFASIIDAAAFWAVYPEADEDVGMTSVDLKVNYLAPCFGGKLIARGRSIKLGKTLGLGEVEVTDAEGRILTHGTSTLIVLPGLAFVHRDVLPPKFIEVP